jgi:hypothetical protein
MKQKTALRRHKRGVGDVWTWVALDSETKLVPTFAVGDRSGYMADCFIEDLASRLSHRVQFSSDALRAYTDAVERAFGAGVDYGSIVKTFSHSDLEEQPRYSPPEVMNAKRIPVAGNPVVDLISQVTLKNKITLCECTAAASHGSRMLFPRNWKTSKRRSRCTMLITIS